MNLGLLDTRCRIERRIATKDAEYGAPVVSWELLGVVWCSIQDELPSKSEAVKNGLEIAMQRASVRMRYRTDVDSSMRLVINRPDRHIYQIVAGPAIVGNKEGLEVFVERYSS